MIVKDIPDELVPRELLCNTHVNGPLSHRFFWKRRTDFPFHQKSKKNQIFIPEDLPRVVFLFTKIVKK
jgi:hypothetical protein